MYHCTPEELDRQTGKYFFEMMQDLKCANWEAKAEKVHNG